MFSSIESKSVMEGEIAKIENNFTFSPLNSSPTKHNHLLTLLPVSIGWSASNSHETKRCSSKLVQIS
jgi:hypothetical protein